MVAVMAGGPLGLTEFLFGGPGLFGSLAFFRRLSQWYKQLPSGLLRPGLRESHIWRGPARLACRLLRGLCQGRVVVRAYRAASFGGAVGCIARLISGVLPG